jgi:hypothetical protein
MPYSPNESRESIKEFIRNYDRREQLWLKRRLDHEGAVRGAVFFGNPDKGPIELVYDMRNYNSLIYNDLDAMIDDGWLID